MRDVTQLLQKINEGDSSATNQLLPLVYEELRKLAAEKMVNERKGHTLQGTALVHEAYVRIVDTDRDQNWDSRGHFFSAAAEAMRRILIDRARKHRSKKRGGDLDRINIDATDLVDQVTPDQLLMIDEALERLSQDDPEAAKLVKLRYFAGLSVEQSAHSLQMSTATAYRHWAYARAWLHSNLTESDY